MTAKTEKNGGERIFYRPDEQALAEGRDIRGALWRGQVRRMFLTNMPAIGVILIIYSGDHSSSLGMLLLFLIGLNVVITPLYLYLARVSLLLTHTLPSDINIGPDKLRFGGYGFSPGEVDGIVLRPVTSGLSMIIRLVEGDGGISKNSQPEAHVTILGLTEADVRELRIALNKAGFRTEVDLGAGKVGEWRPGPGERPAIFDLHFTILLGVMAVTVIKALSLLGVYFEMDDPTAATLSLNLAGLVLILMSVVLHLPDRVSRWRGHSIAGDMKGAQFIRASVQAHWGSAIAVDVMDHAGLLYERQVDRVFGIVEPRRHILLSAVREPRTSIMLREDEDGALTFIVGHTGKGKGTGDEGGMVMEDISQCLQRLERSVARRKKGEMIDFR